MQIQDIMIKLLLKQPFYGYIAASVTPTVNMDVETISSVMTPAPKILYNPVWYETLKEEHAVGALIHELLHILFLHSFRRGGRERQLWAVASDIAVNEHLSAGFLWEDAITVEQMAKELNEDIPRQKSAEYYYTVLSKPDNRMNLIGNDKEVRIVLKDGRQLKANQMMEGDSSEINYNAVKSMLSELVDQAKAEGDMPGSISCLIGETYKEGKINWRNVLKRFLSGKGKVLTKKTCKKESRRFENLPGNKRLTGVEALLAIDESGSIQDSTIERFMNEVLCIKRIAGTSIRVTQFDTECSAPVSIEKYIRKRERSKNGGTDFRPVFQMADAMRIPLVIIFTDGDGEAPKSANQKVLWVLTQKGKKPADFGHYVEFDDE